MHCTQCQHENPEGAKFCNECATQLPLMASGGAWHEAEGGAGRRRNAPTPLRCLRIQVFALGKSVRIGYLHPCPPGLAPPVQVWPLPLQVLGIDFMARPRGPKAGFLLLSFPDCSASLRRSGAGHLVGLSF